MREEDPVIQVKHLSKRYRIGMDRTYKTFCETAVDTLKSPLKRLKSFSKQEETFWALKDINFEVNPGEVVGVIGRNGAGKTTLLKILSRITHLTEGEVLLRGRVGSLLEVGTGFHAELTGRENIYFNGAILGMKKVEIDDNFDEIVKFSGVEKFLDTPVKRYSSGMSVRLAFSVAAHLEPEILLVDEVLAVGDAAFQKKCIGKMKDVSEGGRTVLFVSHNMGAVSNLCSRAILLEQGKIICNGHTNEVIQYYLDNTISKSDTIKLKDRVDRTGNGKIILTDFYIEDASGSRVDFIKSGGSYSFVFVYETINNEKFRHVDIAFNVLNHLDESIFLCHNKMKAHDFGEVKNRGSFRCFIPKIPLVPGRYSLSAAISMHGENLDFVSHVKNFEVNEGDFFGTGENLIHSFIYVDQEWSKG